MESTIQGWLKSRLHDYRYNHSLRVADAAGRLVTRYGIAGLSTVRTAALLHDCARDFSDAELLLMAEAWELEVRPADRQSPVLLHGKVGAELVQRELGISDTALLSAIRFHTSGHPEMGLTDKVVFLADLIEPRRPFPHREQLERVALENIDDALLLALEGNMNHLKRKGQTIDPDAVALRDMLLGDKAV